MHAPGYTHTVASGLALLVSSQRVVFSAAVCSSLPGHSSRLICLSLFISVMVLLCFCGVCVCVSLHRCTLVSPVYFMGVCA